jgi:hypothetical protein
MLPDISFGLAGPGQWMPLRHKPLPLQTRIAVLRSKLIGARATLRYKVQLDQRLSFGRFPTQEG